MKKIEENHLDMPNSPDKDGFAIMLEPTLVHPITRERFTREQLDEIYEKIFAGKDHEHLHDFPRPDRRSRRGGMKPIRRKKTRRKKTRHRKKKRRATKRR